MGAIQVKQKKPKEYILYNFFFKTVQNQKILNNSHKKN